MSLVGDVIVAARGGLADPPATLGVPSATFSVVSASGSTLTAGTYYAIVTQFNPWGETLGTPESAQLTVSANQGIQFTSALLPGATIIRCYLTQVGGSQGTENQFVQSSSSPFTISANPTNAGLPPQNNSAWNPDTDGSSFSATKVYKYLNDALRQASEETGGIKNYSGVGTVKSQQLYTLNGNWRTISDIWYNGYWLMGGDHSYFFKRNSIVSGVLTVAMSPIQDNRTVIELFPQPDRTAGMTTLTAPMGISDTSLTLANSSALLLPMGFIQIDNEIMAYSSISGGTLNGLLRAVGLTAAATHASGANVNELNCFFCGNQIMTVTYVSGNSGLTLPVPSGWKDLLKDYMVYLGKLDLQDSGEAEKYLKYFRDKIAAWARSNNVVLKRRQIGAPTGPQTYGNSMGGGLIVS